MLAAAQVAHRADMVELGGSGFSCRSHKPRMTSILEMYR